MLKRSLPALALALALAPSCDPQAANEGFIDGRVEVPEPPAEGEGLQFVQPEYTVPAGTEEMHCWVPDWIPEEDVYIKAFQGMQSGMGHHVVALTSLTPRAAGSDFDCTELESMTGLNPLIVPDTPSGDLAPDPSLRMFPTDFMVRVPAGSRVVIQSHYVNISDQPVLIADVVRFTLVTPAELETFTEASYFTVNHGFINIPKGESSFETSVTCDIDERLQLTSLLGHMHDWGTAVKIERERAGERETLYEIGDWTVEMRDLPPITQYSPDDPLVFEAGDRLHVSCTYNNTTDHDLKFPQEMCVAFGAYFPAKPEGFVICD